MRLFLLPVSTRRTFMYAQRLHVTTTQTDRNYVDRGAAWAAKKWSEWEKKESGWQSKVVHYGNQAFRRIPYEEWGLKSVPPLSARRQADEIQGKEKVELVFPSKVIPIHKAEQIARTLATERQSLHRTRLMWCFIGMPITIPFALVPVIPNLPFFYLVYRAWSHWRAIAGGKHVQWLIEKKLLQPSPSQTLDQLYVKAAAVETVENPAEKELPLLTQQQVRNFSQTLDVPQLEIELERAIWQVDQALAKEDSAEGAKEQGSKDEKASGSTKQEAKDTQHDSATGEAKKEK